MHQQQQAEAPIVTEYVVKRTLGGKAKSLAFHCPQCNTSLTAALDDAGNHETCPHCAMLFRVPLHEEPPKPKSEPSWYQKDIFGREGKADILPVQKELPRRRTPPPEPQPYQFVYIGAVVLFALGLLSIVASVFVGFYIGGGSGALTWLGGTLNGFFLIVTGQALDAFRDLVLAAKSIDERLGKR